MTNHGNARLKVVGSEDVGESATPYFTVKPDRVQSFRLLVTIPKEDITDEAMDINFKLVDINTEEAAHYESIFRAPEK